MDAATCSSHRWVVVPISTDARLAGHPLAVSLAELKTVLGALHTALDLAMDEPWQSDDAISH